MKDEEQDNRKLVITERFITALDYLIDSGRLKTVAEFERVTGFRQQRITGMRKFLSGEEGIKGYYANTDHISVLNEVYKVSLKYLLQGEKPIMEAEKKSVEQSDSRSEQEGEWVHEIKEEIKLLKEKYNLLKERFEFFVEKQNNQPPKTF